VGREKAKNNNNNNKIHARQKNSKKENIQARVKKLPTPHRGLASINMLDEPSD